MRNNVTQQKFVVGVLASVLVGVVAFVGVCAVVYEGDVGDGGWYPVFEAPIAQARWSPDGARIIMDTGWYPRLVDASGVETKLPDMVVGGYKERMYPRFSPDGLRIVFLTERYEGGDDNSEIAIANLDGTGYRRLTRNRGNQYGPEWSPEGTHIAFHSSHSVPNEPDRKSFGLYTMTASGSSPRKLVDSVQATGPLAWSPDGRQIAFAGYENGHPGSWPDEKYIYIVDRDGSNLNRLAESSSPPAWSPDGSQIAFLQGEDRESLFVISPDGSGLREITHLDSLGESSWRSSPELSWSPDGSAILLQGNPFILVRVDGETDAEGEAVYAVFDGPDHWSNAHATWSPDGSRIAIAVDRYEYVVEGPNIGKAILITMASDGTDQQVLLRARSDVGVYTVANEPWEERGEWVWQTP